MTDTYELDNAVDVLTRPWTDVLSPRESGTGTYRPIDYPPLLDMLKDAIGSSLGKTQPGRSPDAERSLLNLQAFQLWEHIDGTTRAWTLELSKTKPPTNLKDALRQLAGHIKAARATHQLDDRTYTHMVHMLNRWRTQVWELFDPPVVKDLIGACPNCAETVYYNLEGGKSPALIAYYWKGIEPQAKCQRCGEHWAGQRALLELGYSLGATVDHDTLREMGVV